MYEYSVFGVRNPFEAQNPEEEESFSDTYVHITPDRTLKRRLKDGASTTITYKERIRYDPDTDLDFFEHTHFPDNSAGEPLQSFLTLHRLEGILESTDGRFIKKNRWAYQDSGVQVYFTEFFIDGRRDTNLTLVARQPEQIAALRERLGLMEKNLNFATYLLNYVANVE